MVFYLIIFIIFILLIGVLISWVFKLIKDFKKDNRKPFYIQATILAIVLILITWQLQIFPFSKNFYINRKTERLTGKYFWNWKEYDYGELGVRGEGYSLDIYKYNDDVADFFSSPTSNFTKNYPPSELADVKWTKTPVKPYDQKTLDFVTPIYGNWKGEIVDRQKFIKMIAMEDGGFYSYKSSGGTDFYLISPKRNIIILINHDM